MVMYLYVNLYVVPKFIIMHSWCVKLRIVGKLSIMPEFRTFSYPLKLHIMVKVTYHFYWGCRSLEGSTVHLIPLLPFHCSRRMKNSKLAKERLRRWGKLEWKFITPWNCTPTHLVPLLENLWSQTWGLREVAGGGCNCEFKSPCQRKPRLSYCLRQIALQRCGSAKVVEALKQSASSQGNTRVFLLISGKKNLM
jgi:hypothetical protein